MTTADKAARRILVVEDDGLVREAMSAVLQGEGYRVDAAENGREALDYLRADGRPDLILLDLMMPVMDGWEFRRQQCCDEALASVPVVVVSAADSVQSTAASLGAAGFLQKPVDVATLLRAVGRHCG